MICATILLLPVFLPQQEAPSSNPKKEPLNVWELLQEKYDADGDGRITLREHGRGEAAFRNLDRDGDGLLTEMDTRMTPGRKRNRRGQQERSKSKAQAVKPPVVGEIAPDFELLVLGPEEEELSKETTKEHLKRDLLEKASPRIRLSSFAGERPVALIFGSYT